MHFSSALHYLRWKVSSLFPPQDGYVRTWYGTFAVDEHDGLSQDLQRYGVYDVPLSAEIRRLAKPGMVVCNVGANIGYMAKLATSRGATVYAFEPDERCIRILRRNADDRFRVAQVAVGDRDGTVTLFRDAVYGDNSLAEENTRAAEPVTVPMTTLDTYPGLRESHPELIVMDIQGAEVRALRGMRQLLRESCPIVLLEFWPFGLENCNDDPSEVIRLLHACGYRVQSLERRLPDPETKWDELLDRLRSTKGGKGICTLKAVPC